MGRVHVRNCRVRLWRRNAMNRRANVTRLVAPLARSMFKCFRERLTVAHTQTHNKNGGAINPARITTAALVMVPKIRSLASGQRVSALSGAKNEVEAKKCPTVAFCLFVSLLSRTDDVFCTSVRLRYSRIGPSPQEQSTK